MFAVSTHVVPSKGRYALLKSAPAVIASEVLDAVRSVAFLTIHWGDSVVFAGEIDRKLGFDLGELTDAETPDETKHFELPSEILGSARVPFVRYSGDAVLVAIPSRAVARIVNDQGHDITLPGLPHDAPAREITLTLGSRAVISLPNLRFEIDYGAAGRKCARAALLPEAEVLAFHAMSFAVVGSLLGAMAYFLPSLGLLADEDTTREDLYLITQYLDANAERQKVEQNTGDVEQGGQSTGDSSQPVTETPATQSGPEGRRRFAPTNQLHTSHRENVEMARQFGMINLLHTLGSEPSATWHADVRDFVGAQPGLWGDELGDEAGNGLRLSSDGDGGGGPGTGIDMGGIEVLPGGKPGLPGGDFGKFVGRPGAPGYTPKGPKIGTVGQTVVSGHLPPELIQRTVRQNFGRFRMCYEQGLGRNPSLTGRVEVRFLIDSSGTVANVAQGASDLPDSGVVSCIVKAFYGLSFPAPENGTVRVTYPLMLSPAS
jgi:hypothetical protein